MLGETGAQAARDFAQNIKNPEWRAAAANKIKGEILGEVDQFGVMRGVSKDTNEALKQAEDANNEMMGKMTGGFGGFPF